MAMITAYIDDSGTDADSAIAVAAGFVSDVGRWGRFESDWRALLKSEGLLDKGFHMSAFMAKPRRGVFSGWDDHKAKGLYDGLIRTINGTTLMGFSASVDKSAYDETVRGKLREKLGGHYRFCVATCMWQIQKWMRSQPAFLREPVKYVFARGTKGNDEVYQLFGDLLKFPLTKEEFGITGIPPFEMAATTLPLQAADIIAWSSTRHLRKFNPSRPFMPEIPGTKTRHCLFFPKEALEKYVPEIIEKYEATNWSGPPGGFV